MAYIISPNRKKENEREGRQVSKINDFLVKIPLS